VRWVRDLISHGAAAPSDGRAAGDPVSLTPAAAASAATSALVAGSQADALRALRGFGQSRALLPDARCFVLLPASALTSNPHPAYGRAPDARLPLAAQVA